MGLNIYAVTFLMSVLLVVALIVVGHRQNITYYLLMFVTAMISCMGYYSIASAETLETAVMGHRLVYLGGVFIPMLMLLSVMKLCKVKTPRRCMFMLLAYSMVVLYYAYSVQHRTDYYKSLALGKENGMTYLIKEYGPMHSLYMILLFGCIGITVAVIVYSIFKKKNVSHRITICLLSLEFISIGCYIWRRVSGSNLEILPVTYLIIEVVILFLIKRIGMYEVAESVAKSLDEHSTYGYLVFDNKGRYVGCNHMAEHYVPEVCRQKVDEELTKDNTPMLYEEFGNWLQNPDEEKCQCIIETGYRVLKCSLKFLYHGKRSKKIGYLIEIVDDTQQQKYMKLLNNYNADLEDEVQKKTEHINMMQDKIVLGMADMVENRDSNTGGHIKRTSAVIRIFTNELEKHGNEYGFTKEFLNYVAKAAPMHDLGKIAVDDQILRKPGKYTPEEFEEMKKHAEKGADIVTQIMSGVEDEKFLEIARNVAHYHHEKWNGQGYPEGKSGIDIPVEARIMALADVFDALVSKRCYKEKMDYDKAFAIIEESLGSHFDPELGKMFLRCRPQLEEYYDGME